MRHCLPWRLSGQTARVRGRQRRGRAARAARIRRVRRRIGRWSRMPGTPKDLEPYEKFSKPYYQNYTHAEHLYRGGAGHSRSDEREGGADRLSGPGGEAGRPGVRAAHAARGADGHRRGQRARRLRRQALPADDARRLQQLAVRRGRRRGAADGSRPSGERRQTKR